MRHPKIAIKAVKWANSANSRWIIEGLRDDSGKRIRKFFPSRDAASEWLRERRPELKNQGRAAMGLSDSQRTDAVRALALLTPYGASLTEAAKEFVERAELLSRTVTFAQLATELVAAKKADGASREYLRDLHYKTDAFSRSFGQRMVATIESRELDDWLRALDVAPLTRNGYRRNLGVAFSYARSRGYVRENPITSTAEAKVVLAAPGILTPTEFLALLNHSPDDLVPSLALGGFAGLREAEISRLDWRNLNLGAGHIKIDAGQAKTGARRVVPALPALVEWVAAAAQSEGRIHPPKYHRLLKEARIAAAAFLKDKRQPAPNLESWPHNALRHSFISYRLASVENAAQVALEAGHGQAVLHRHYKALVTPAEGAAWFALRPDHPSAVVPFNSAAAAS